MCRSPHKGLRLDVGKDFVTLRRELGGGWSNEEHGYSFETPLPMTGVMNDLNNAIDAELDRNQNKVGERWVKDTKGPRRIMPNEDYSRLCRKN